MKEVTKLSRGLTIHASLKCPPHSEDEEEVVPHFYRKSLKYFQKKLTILRSEIKQRNSVASRTSKGGSQAGSFDSS